MAREHGVGVVPFYNLTAARHAMHRRHFCSFHNQKKVANPNRSRNRNPNRNRNRNPKPNPNPNPKPKPKPNPSPNSNPHQVGRCCDCTHFCYTPLFWDAFFARLRRAVTAHPHYTGLRPPALNRGSGALDGGGGGGRGGRGGGRRRRRGGRRGSWASLRGELRGSGARGRGRRGRGRGRGKGRRASTDG